MALTTSNIIVATSGEVYVAAVATALPTAPATTGFTGLGYVSEDGVSITREFNKQEIRAWQSPYPVKSIPTEATFTVSATFIESSDLVQELFYGLDGSGEADVEAAAVERAVLFDFTDGTKTFRVTIPRAEVSADGEQSLSRGDAAGYPLVFTALPPDTGPLYTVVDITA